MPNGKPGDHPLTDIVDHHLQVFSARADGSVRQLDRFGLGKSLWGLLYCLYREGDAIMMAGKRGRIPVKDFEQLLSDLVDALPPAISERAQEHAGRLMQEKRAWLEQRLAT